MTIESIPQAREVLAEWAVRLLYRAELSPEPAFALNRFSAVLDFLSEKKNVKAATPEAEEAGSALQPMLMHAVRHINNIGRESVMSDPELQGAFLAALVEMYHYVANVGITAGLLNESDFQSPQVIAETGKGRE